MLYRLFRLLARVMLTLFFRRIEVEGRTQVPQDGPVLFVPNHTNALVDPLILMISLRRRLTLTAKNVLAKSVVGRAFMAALGVVVFHRREDVGHGADRKQNLHSLEQCRRILRQGGAVCIFPEGISHSDPTLRPFRAGVARIALEYVREDHNPGNLRIVPVGLLYTAKDQFRSGVWLRYGQPMDVGRWLEENPQADSHALTDEIRRRVEDLTVNFQRRRESLILTWAAEILATSGTAPNPLGWQERSLATDYQLLQRLQAGYQALVVTRHDEVETLTKRVRKYRTELKRLGISPQEVYLPLHFGKALFFLFRELELLAIGAPVALFGALNHLLPYVIVKGIARKLSRDKDHWATNVVYPSFLVFPLCYAIQIAGVWCVLSAFWTAVYIIALPYTGYVALLYGDRAGSAWRRLRTFTYFAFNRSHQQELAREGQAIIAGIRALAEQLPQLTTAIGDLER